MRPDIFWAQKVMPHTGKYRCPTDLSMPPNASARPVTLPWQWI